MKLERIPLSEAGAEGGASAQLRQRRMAVALVAGAILWLLAWYWETARAMVSIWQRSDTFAHGFLIVPISAWLIWQRRDVLAGITIRPGLLALPVLALAGFAWLLGELAGAGVVQQFGLVVMIGLLPWAILGPGMARSLAFPLFFLLFAVPFGEFLEPPLMEHTANFVVAALRATGIPVYREGLYFTIPTGNWSIVEACSGLRYLIASLTVGFLYAYLTYRSFWRRAAFVAVSLVVPIIANWLRAYMVVMLGHLSGMTLAVGVDHLVYGWVFFGIVMLLLFWVGSFWREDLRAETAAPGATAPAAQGRLSLSGIVGSAVAAALVVAVWPALAYRMQDAVEKRAAPALHAPGAAGGWRPVPGRLADWTPKFQNPRGVVEQLYASGSRSVGVYVGYYRGQRPGAQLISSQNELVQSGSGGWKNLGEVRRNVTLNGAEIPVVEARLQGSATNLLVWRWYRIEDHNVINSYWAKFLQAQSMLLGHGDDGAVIVIFAPSSDRPEAAEQSLREFAGAMLPAITTSLEHARRTRPGS